MRAAGAASTGVHTGILIALPSAAQFRFTAETAKPADEHFKRIKNANWHPTVTGCF
jgi:hypothetical protein